MNTVVYTTSFKTCSICLCVLFKHNMYLCIPRMVTEINIQTAEPNVDVSPHYVEILEEDSMLTAPQGTHYLKHPDIN